MKLEPIIFDRNIFRPSFNSTRVTIGDLTGEVEYTSDWESVSGGKGVTCRTWRIEGDEGKIFDGADIKMEPDKNGRSYTGLQQVNQVVVDVPNGKVTGLVLDPMQGGLFIHQFDTPEVCHHQFVYRPGLVTTLIATTSSQIVEVESPAFNANTFKNLSEDDQMFQKSSAGQIYLTNVKKYRHQTG